MEYRSKVKKEIKKLIFLAKLTILGQFLDVTPQLLTPSDSNMTQNDCVWQGMTYQGPGGVPGGPGGRRGARGTPGATRLLLTPK